MIRSRCGILQAYARYYNDLLVVVIGASGRYWS